MQIVKNYHDTERVVTSFDIQGINVLEMQQITAVRNKVFDILVNHRSSIKSRYLTDDDLLEILVILDTLSEKVPTLSSVFTDRTFDMLMKVQQEADKIDNIDNEVIG